MSPEPEFELAGRRVLVTGGAGFIGSHLVRRLLGEVADLRVVTLDALTYAGQRSNLAEVEDDPRHELVVGDVCDRDLVDDLVSAADIICHLAAETHVDRSIADGITFVRTDVVGTTVLLEAVRRHGIDRLLHVSTDEVYGQIESGSATESSPLEPRNPYSASKAAAEHMVRAYGLTHELPVLIARPSNHYGPHQYPEKFIPLFIVNALAGRALPLYGDGRQRREWTHVEDGVEALVAILRRGPIGGIYNVSSGEERTNIDVAQAICRHVGADVSLIRHVQDRPGHDRRYAMKSSLIRTLDWAPRRAFEDGLESTVAWYLERRDWWEPIVESSPAYRSWVSSHYADS